MQPDSLLAQLAAGIEWWNFIAGLGLFLFGMTQTEAAMEPLAGEGTKAFLRRNTDHPLRAVTAGTVATALMQSSSLVGLLTLAMVGAQAIAMSNALGIIVGANLGTTLTGWIVASLGFKLDLTDAALPIIAIGSLGLVITGRKSRVAAACQLLTGIGLLLFGLEWMKSSVEATSLTLSDGGHAWTFLGLGVLVTAIIQSSSAAMMIALAALHAGALPLIDAAAFVIGADLGTTSTVIVGALKGSPDKRRVGLGHFLFNLSTDALAFFVLLPLVPFVAAALHTVDPLYLLVGFHTTFNLVGVAIFLPLLGPFAKLVSRFFKKRRPGLAPTLVASLIVDVDSALTAMRNETIRLAVRVQNFNMRAISHGTPFEDAHAKRQYREIKSLEGELLAFGLSMQKVELSIEQSQTLNSIIAAARNLVHSAKSMKDSVADLHALRNSLTRSERELYRAMHDLATPLCTRLMEMAKSDAARITFADLVEIGQINDHNHDKIHHMIFEQLRGDVHDWATVSSFLNANRELYISNSDFILALGGLGLTSSQQDDLRSLPRTHGAELAS